MKSDAWKKINEYLSAHPECRKYLEELTEAKVDMNQKNYRVKEHKEFQLRSP